MILDCEHKPLKPILDGKPTKHGFSMTCTDCGTTLFCIGTDLYDRMTKLEEFRSDEINDDIIDNHR